jgi:hypothetical protein
MPLRPFLNGAVFEPEAIRNMSVAFESVCAELGLSDKDDPATRLVASKIIEFAQSGVLDAARLRSMTRTFFLGDVHQAPMEIAAHRTRPPRSRVVIASSSCAKT